MGHGPLDDGRFFYHLGLSDDGGEQKDFTGIINREFFPEISRDEKISAAFIESRMAGKK